MKTKILTTLLLFFILNLVVSADYEYFNSINKNDNSWIYVVPLNYNWNLESHKNYKDFDEISYTQKYYDNYNWYNNVNNDELLILDESSDLTNQFINTAKTYFKNLNQKQTQKSQDLINNSLLKINNFKIDFKNALLKKDYLLMQNALDSIKNENTNLFNSLKKYVKSTKLDKFKNLLKDLNQDQENKRWSLILKVKTLYWE